ncbi:flagellar operon protein [Peribacillus deserti]|uniref:Flagellar operon protein n=1 Tax=Peribacillus deserti TaxID=673318 RepID=A0ABS2QH15_9BACI|nr:TIGR02530 family flagellar biosynthesis protein [Peribacillus deserti]MBM7692260.1 flagellar operon protein [Peribacillus deserti]
MEKVNIRPISNAPLPVYKKQGAFQQQTLKTSFAQQLQNAALPEPSKLMVSKHAKARLEQRNIQIDQASWNKLEEKVLEAKKMGVQDSLVLMKNAALIVSAKNNTVITAMDRTEAGAQIFTNINGTIVME